MNILWDVWLAGVGLGRPVSVKPAGFPIRVAERSGELRQLINNYKFENMYAAHRLLAELIDINIRLPQLPPDTIIIPVPTIPSHIRQRGYDHMLLVAKELAKRRHLKLSQSLYRVTSTRQRDANRATRIAQAKNAFIVRDELDKARPYLLVDDVITTGRL